jgi:fatty acid desaturase
MTGTQNVTPQAEMRQPQSRRSSLVGLLVWWIGIAAVANLVAAALVDVAYSRAVYLFIVMPVGGVLLFPAAWAANRWLTPVIGSRIRRS